jgi:hypothetical protein
LIGQQTQSSSAFVSAWLRFVGLSYAAKFFFLSAKKTCLGERSLGA